MLSRITSGSVTGLEGHKVDVEVDLSLGLPAFNIVGLPDAAVQESKERVRAALTNCEFQLPVRRIVVNLAPGDMRKEGPCFDLPIAIAVLRAAEPTVAAASDDYLIVGELSLDGRAKPITGVLPLAVAAKSMGVRGLIVPAANAGEAAVVKGLEVIGVDTLVEAVDFLSGALEVAPFVSVFPSSKKEAASVDDLADVKGQEHAKRALEIAAAGAHNALMIGPPGSGKSMLARRLPGILPAMDLNEAIDVTRVYSVAAMLAGKSLVEQRPFRSPHHTISNAGLVGGGQNPRPGEISLSHNGVLFLDEFAEFRKDVLQVLRQPMEDGSVTISRASGVTWYPSKFMMVAAMNPCPCGYHGDRFKECVCPLPKVKGYLSRVSGPLMDRIDLHIEVPRLSKEELMKRSSGESSAAVRKRVEKARQRQRLRAESGGPPDNASLTSKGLREFCSLNREATLFMEAAIDKLRLSARGFDRVLKVARTVADLDASESIESVHLAEAVSFRALDRQLF